MNGSLAWGTLALFTIASRLAAQAQQPLFTQQEVSGAQHGSCITGLGDVNGNGRGDVAIGSPTDLGWQFVPFGGSVMIVDGTGSPHHFVYGFQGDRLGMSALGVGDVTGDGVPDFAVGATQGDQIGNARLNGYVGLFSGASFGNLPVAFVSAGVTPLASAPNPDFFGRHLGSVGDWTGDGIAEFLVGAPMGHNPPVFQAQGYVQVHNPVALAGGNATPLVRIAGPAPASMFGHTSCRLADLTGDGIPEFAVTALREQTSGSTLGTVRVFVGGTGVLLRVIQGANDQFGSSLAWINDINNDGVGDLACGVPAFGLFKGRVQVVSGAFIATGTGPQTLATWRAADQHEPFVSINWDLFGTSMANMGDLDGDGFDDLLVGAPEGPSWDPDTDELNWPMGHALNTCGYARLMTTKGGKMIKAFRGEADGDYFGEVVANVGDLDGDGIADLGIGARLKDIAGGTNNGRSYFYAGAYKLGSSYGQTAPNSVGTGALMGATGSLSVSANNFKLRCTVLPAQMMGLFFYGAGKQIPPSPFYDGFLNIASGGIGVFRLPAVSTGPNTPAGATATYTYDLTMPPAPAGLILAGSRWYFQFWYRDTGFGANGANASDGLSVGFVN